MRPESQEYTHRTIHQQTVFMACARRLRVASSRFFHDEEGLSTVDSAMVGYLVCLTTFFGSEILGWAILAYKRWVIYGWAGY